MNARAAVLVAVMLVAVWSCSGNGGSVAPQPSASASPPPIVEPAATAVRQMAQLALSTLHANLFLQRVVRPGLGPLLTVPALATATPACDPATATAFAASPTVTRDGTLVSVAFYPAGDTVCSSSPLGALVYVVPTAAAQPQIIRGYFAEYGQIGSAVSPGRYADYEPFNAAVFSTTDGSANVRIQSQPNTDVNAGNLPSAPFAGTFPATFPTLPAPADATLLNGAGAVDDLIIAEGKTLDQISYINDYPGGITGATPSLNRQVITIDNLLTSVTIAASGARALVSTTRGAYASVDIPQSPPAYLPSPFPGPPGFASFSVPPADRTSAALIATTANYGTKQVMSGTFSANGWPSALQITYTDSVTKVSVKLATSNGGISYQLYATDLVDGAPLLATSPLQIDAGGTSSATTFNLDGTRFQTQSFSIAD